MRLVLLGQYSVLRQTGTVSSASRQICSCWLVEILASYLSAAFIDFSSPRYGMPTWVLCIWPWMMGDVLRDRNFSASVCLCSAMLCGFNSMGDSFIPCSVDMYVEGSVSWCLMSHRLSKCHLLQMAPDMGNGPESRVVLCNQCYSPVKSTAPELCRYLVWETSSYVYKYIIEKEKPRVIQDVEKGISTSPTIYPFCHL